MYFNPTKSIHLSINVKVGTEYRIARSDIMARSVHKDLSIVMSDDLSWNQHNEKIIPKAYRMLGLLHHCFSQFQFVFTKRALYLSLVRSQVMYCSIVWRPNLIKNITLVKRIQRRETKFILNDYDFSYFDRLKKLNLLPLMYIFELNEVLLQ